MGVLDAAVQVNTSDLATLLIYDKMGMERGFHIIYCCLDENTRRLKNAT